MLALGGPEQHDTVSALSLCLLVLAGLICAAVLARSRDLAALLRLYDIPNARKIHRDPKPKIGGVIIVVLSILSVLVLPLGEEIRLAFVIGGAIVAVTGLIDDVLQLTAPLKLVGQTLAVAAGLYFLDFSVDPYLDAIAAHFELPLIGDAPPWLGTTVVGFLWVVAVNAANFADGLDGLLAGLVVSTLGGFWLIASSLGAPDVQILAAILIGCVIGFLAHNHHPATTFMGDTGSNFLGYALGLLLICSADHLEAARHEQGGALWLFALIGYPLLDTLFVLTRRLHSRARLFQADRRHLHYALIEGGLSHERSVQVIVGFQAAVVTTVLATFDGLDALWIGVL